MEPVKLILTDFCGHKYSEIDFTKFSSALITGKKRGNTRNSNACGKSTILHAIEYVLFNNIHFSTLSKIVRDDCEICRVIFEFISKDINYKIVRSMSIKSGSDIRLYKKNGQEWVDLTQRRIGDNEKELEKILGFNHKAFCSSVLFVQSGSEKVINIAQFSPGKRKNLLKEILQLDRYSDFEKITKNKITSLSKELDEKRIALGILNKNILEPTDNLKKQKDVLDTEILSLNNLLSSVKEKKEILLKNKSDNISKIQKIISDNDQFLTQKKVIEQEIIKLKNNIDFYIKKINSINENSDCINKNIFNINNEIKSCSDLLISDINDIVATCDNLTNKISEESVNSKTLLLKINELSVPIPKDDICKHCRQTLTEEHRKLCQSLITKELQDTIYKKNCIDKEINKFLSDKKELQEKIKNNNLIKEKINALTVDLKYQESELLSYQKILDEHFLSKSILEKNLEEKENRLLNLKGQQTELISELKNNEKTISNEIAVLDQNIDIYSKNIQSYTNEITVLLHKIKRNEEKLLEISNLTKEISNMDCNLNSLQRVGNAFSSNGIPSMIISSIIDIFQEETNIWLNKLRPGLQVQFNLIKEKIDGNIEDTLEINYILDGRDREFKQISGSEKFISVLGLKLGLISLLNKKFGIDIKLLLLDECDESLDEFNKDLFMNVIKILQESFKILVISHDKNIKDQFPYVLTVEQDEDKVSTITNV